MFIIDETSFKFYWSVIAAHSQFNRPTNLVVMQCTKLIGISVALEFDAKKKNVAFKT